jgi:hypothetical protein
MLCFQGHGLDEIKVVGVKQALAQVLMCFQNVTGQREELVLARDEKDVLKGLWREHLVVQKCR